MLVNFGLNRETFYKVIDFAFYSGLSICLLTYAGYLGFIKITTYTSTGFVESTLFATRASHLINLNQVSYICAFSILLLIIKRHKEKLFSLIYICRDFAVILLLTGIVILNASRGASIICLVLTFYYIHLIWRFGIMDRGIKACMICVALISIIVLYYNVRTFVKPKTLESQFSIAKRFGSGITTHQRGIRYDGRIVNALNAWGNFSEHPFTGVGYRNAAIRDNFGTRSNNQYLHLLGSSGFILFIIYIYYNFRLVAFNFILLKMPEITLCVFFHTFYLSVKRPFEIVAIMGYIAIYFYYESKRKTS